MPVDPIPQVITSLHVAAATSHQGSLRLEPHQGHHSGHVSISPAPDSSFPGFELSAKCLHLGVSPVVLHVLQHYLQFYPNIDDAMILSQGFQRGFTIEYTGQREAFEARNLKSAFDHEAQLLEKIYKEVSLGRIVGPFDTPPLKNLHVSPVGLVPKTDGGWRLITHLSFPLGTSINDGIDVKFCSVQYTSFDKVTDMIYGLGRSALIAKRDLKSAYRLMPIRKEDFSLLGIKVDGKYFVDKFLPMGLSQSAFLFEKFSTFLQWLVEEKTGITTMAHLLDDFLMAGRGDSHDCQKLVSAFEATCKELGVPIAVEKSVDPTTSMVFLGLEIDTNEMSVRIPGHKIVELESLIRTYLNRKKVSLRDLQKLVGKLIFFGQAVRSSRAFLRRFYDVMSPLRKPFNMLRLTREIRNDLLVWLVFLQEFNGVTYIPERVCLTSDSLRLFTDASGSAHLGAASFLDGQWCFLPWPKAWGNHAVLKDLTFLEMVPVLLAIFLWYRLFQNKRVHLYIDNEALVYVLNKQTSKSKLLMQLVRPFVLMSMKYNIVFKAVHILSRNNVIADSISRKQWVRFRQAAPEAEGEPLAIPQGFQSVISKLKLDVC